VTDQTCIVDDCDLILVPKNRYYKGPKTPGTAAAGGHGLCQKHHHRMVRNGTTDRQRPHRPGPRLTSVREHRSREEVLEDYALIRDDVNSIAQAAERMGMTFSALDMALYRARKLGDPRALPPLPQLERAIANGTWKAA
jgi:hypothetical protein